MISTRALLIASLFAAISFACKNEQKAPATESGIKDSQLINPSDNVFSSNPNLDISPMDMIYYPVDYTILKMTKKITTPPVARVIYSRPRVQGRKIFGELLQYNVPWRLGANESTEIQFFREINIQGTKIPAGRYSLYCIPNEKNWTIVFNSNTDCWGLRIDQSKDLYRFVIPVLETTYHEEYFTMKFENKDKGMQLVMSWENVMARLPINVN